jgi:hypothetical protein
MATDGDMHQDGSELSASGERPLEQPDPVTRMFGCIGKNFLVGIIILVLVVAYIMLRTLDSGLASLPELDKAIAGGQPTLLEFYSNT